MHATRVYTDYREMLARERLDVVSICTWDQAHAENVVDSLVAVFRCQAPAWERSPPSDLDQRERSESYERAQ